jgi:hypothetical protein
MRSLFVSSLVLLSLFIIIGCQKDFSELENNNNPLADDEVASTSSSSSSSSTPRLSYGDTLFYLRNQAGNYIIPAVSRPNVAGRFKAMPKGLALDTITGNINVTQSETGIRYKVYYVSPTGTSLDSVKLVISGIDYKDAIYEIAATPNAYDTAFPIYNARQGIPLPCGDDDEDDDGDLDDDDNTCVFDETDLNDDGNDDIPGVIQDKLLVDIKKGTIDVEASFHAGIFGSSNPPNGISKDFTFYYRLQDASNRALNKITVRVYHYKKRADIPQALLDTINIRNNISAAVNSRLSNNVTNSNTSFTGQLYSSRLAEYATKAKRPPIIIVVSD